jgi:predicted enzyme involved in methoxymalonyl-ACP biosynthesis
VAWLERMLSFPNTRGTEEARRRTELYRQRVARKDALRPALDYPTMMASLELAARFGPARGKDLERIAELVQRTNQFNTTTVRYSREQLQHLLRDPARAVYTASLADKFGSAGLVSVVVVRREGADRVLDAFVMSCRAMGFGLERLVLRRVLDAEAGPGVRFVGRYVPTERNGPCSALYTEAGFTRESDTEWVLAPGTELPDVPPGSGSARWALRRSRPRRGERPSRAVGGEPLLCPASANRPQRTVKGMLIVPNVCPVAASTSEARNSTAAPGFSRRK